MLLLAWIVLGSIAGFVASKLVNQQGEGYLVDIALGIVGAIVGGFLFDQLGTATGLDLYSAFVPLLGSVVVLASYQTVFGRPPQARPIMSEHPSHGATLDPEERGEISLHSRRADAPGEVR